MEPTDESFEALLRYMRDSRGFDFTGYKRTSLMRRVRHRMDHAGYESFEQYLDVLQASSEEFSALFNTILINVTAFFRDPDAWEFVRTDVIPVCSPNADRTTRSGCGARAAHLARRPTRWPSCSPKPWALTPSGSGSRSMPPTSTRRPLPEPRRVI